MEPSSTPPDAPHPLEELLREGQTSLDPSKRVQQRIWRNIQQHIDAPAVLTDMRTILTPDAAASQRTWGRIFGRLQPFPASLWERLRTQLFPQSSTQSVIRRQVMLRLQPVPAYSYSSHPLKWVAAFVMVALVTASSPFFFLAPHTIANAEVTVQSQQVFLLSDGLWQPVGQTEFIFSKSALLQTGKYPATIIYYDDAVIRMPAGETTIAIHDLTDRPAEPSYNTMTVYKGRVWVQGLVTDNAAPITIVAGDVQIALHESSVSVDQNGNVQVWNGRAVLSRGGQEVTLLAGQQVRPRGNEPLVAQKTPETEYDAPWVTKNLASDAVHQREIAQMQKERLAAAAGILPTSPLYMMKRAAEVVDRTFTFSQEEKTKKMLTHANTRLKEAAALLADGNTDASAPLAEYREAILTVASGSTVAQNLAKEEIINTTADLSATLPTDDAYQLRVAVLDTAAALPNSPIKNVQDVLLADKLEAVKRTVEEGKEVSPQDLSDIAPHLVAAEGASAELKDAAASLSVAQNAFDTTPILPTTPKEPLARPRTVADSIAPYSGSPEDRAAAVGMLLGNLETYQSKISIAGQANAELRKLRNNPDRDAIVARAIRDAQSPYKELLMQTLREWQAEGKWK